MGTFVDWTVVLALPSILVWHLARRDPLSILARLTSPFLIAGLAPLTATFTCFVLWSGGLAAVLDQLGASLASGLGTTADHSPAIWCANQLRFLHEGFGPVALAAVLASLPWLFGGLKRPNPAPSPMPAISAPTCTKWSGS